MTTIKKKEQPVVSVSTSVVYVQARSRESEMSIKYHILILLGVAEFFHSTYGRNLIHQVMEFYRMKNIGSVNFFLCDRQGTNLVQENIRNEIFNSTFLSNWSFKKIKGNMSHVDAISNSQMYRIGIVMNLSCSSSLAALQILGSNTGLISVILFPLLYQSNVPTSQISENALFNTSYAYALISQQPKDKVIDLLEPLNIQFDSDVTLFTHNEIYDLFRTSKASPMKAVFSGNYDELNETVSYFPSVRWDLEGTTINAATVVKDFKWNEGGFTKFVDSDSNPEIDALSRFALVAHLHLEYLCNFKTNLSLASDWGYFREETGHFDRESMFGWLEQGKVEFGLALSRLYSGRLAIAYYTPVTFNFKSCVLFRHPPAGASYDGFARPFTASTWVVTGATVILASLILSIIKRKDAVVDPTNEPGYPASLLNVVAILALQGSYINSMRLPTRVTSLVLHYFGLMVYSYYAAEIVGFLLTPSPRTITTVEKLVENRIDMWVENVSFHRIHFERKVGAIATKYYEIGVKGTTRDKDKFLDPKIALRMVQKGGVALYGQNAELYRLIEDTFTGPEICSLHSIRMLELPTSSTVRKKSPYREIYNRGISRFIESGLLDVQHRRWHTSKPGCIGAESNSPVTLEATLIAQLIYVGGVCLTIFIFALEKRFPPRKGVKTNNPSDHDFMSNKNVEN